MLSLRKNIQEKPPQEFLPSSALSSAAIISSPLFLLVLGFFSALLLFLSLWVTHKQFPPATDHLAHNCAG